MVVVVDPHRVVGPGQRYASDGRRLHGQRREILGLQRVKRGLAAGPGEQLRLDGQRVQEVVDPLGRLIGVQTRAQFRVLRRHADRAAPRVAVVAVARLRPDLLGVSSPRRYPCCSSAPSAPSAQWQSHPRPAQWPWPHQHRSGYHACIDQRNLAAFAEIVDGFARLTDRGHAGHARCLRWQGEARPRCRLPSRRYRSRRGRISRPSARRHRRGPRPVSTGSGSASRSPRGSRGSSAPDRPGPANLGAGQASVDRYPAGSERISATWSVTFWPIRCPPRPTLQP